MISCMIKGIPSNHIVRKVAKRNKDYEVDFANTESNNDIYELKAFLRHGNKQYKVRLVLVSGILAYPALDMSWVFADDEYELGSRVFHRICDEIDDIKTHYDGSMTPVSTLGAQIREAVKPISASHRENTNIPWIDEAGKLAGVSDWRASLYRGQYPKMTRADKEQIIKLEGNHILEVPPKFREYTIRQKY